MELGPFYTGQVPREPLTIVVRDSFSDRAVDLTGYTQAGAVFVNPEDETVPNGGETEWPAEIANPESGEVRIPLDASPFQRVGDHKLQLVLRDGGTAEDITSVATFEVYRKLGG